MVHSKNKLLGEFAKYIVLQVFLSNFMPFFMEYRKSTILHNVTIGEDSSIPGKIC